MEGKKKKKNRKKLIQREGGEDRENRVERVHRCTHGGIKGCREVAKGKSSVSVRALRFRLELFRYPLD